MDMLFCVAVVGKRRDLLNPDCPLLPPDFSSPNFTCSDEKMCVLTDLSEKYGGITCIYTTYTSLCKSMYVYTHVQCIRIAM